MEFTGIVLIQVVLLAVQAGSFIYAINQGQSPLETHYGISIYMCLPIVLLNYA